MKTIHKQALNLQGNDEITLSLPVSSCLLSAQFQHGGLQLWCECDTETVLWGFIQFYSIGTGEEIPTPDNKPLTYLTTVQHLDGYRIWHIYYRWL